MVIGKERLVDLITTAFEGGINYWARIEKVQYDETLIPEEYKKYKHIAWVYDPNGMIAISYGALYDKSAVLTLPKLIMGIEKTKEQYNWHYMDFENDCCDAETADVIVQVSLFGKIVFG
jgi:hypothetical protein